MSKHEKTPYHRAARFPGEREAGAVYFRIQDLIEPPECELSAYRLMILDVWHVAIVGDAPSDELAVRLEMQFSRGESVN